MNRPKITGWILIILGIAQMVYAGSVSVSVPSEPSIANTDLMMQREMYFNGGGFAFLAGCIMLAAERIVAALKPSGGR